MRGGAGGAGRAWRRGATGGGQAAALTFGAGLVTLQATPYPEGLEFARAVEQAGFDGLWAAEHHLTPNGYLPSPLVYLAAAAGATTRLRLGTAVALAPLYSTPRLAEDTAVLQNLSAGRLTLGLGTGWREAERRFHGAAGVNLEESVTALRAAWGVATPAPEPPVPVLLGGFSNFAARRAGRIADGWVTIREKPELMREKVAVMRSAAADPDRLDLVILVSCHVRADGRAWEEVRAAALADARTYAGMAEGERAPGTVIEPDEDRLRRSFICGTPKEAVERFQPLLEATAAHPRRHIVLRAAWPGLSLDATVASLRLFAAEVAPRLT